VRTRHCDNGKTFEIRWPSNSELTSTLKQIGEIEIPSWDLIDLLNKDIDLANRLRNTAAKVMDWDFQNRHAEV
jgi:hypothetical protein